MRGLNQRQVEVRINPARMRSHGVDVRDICRLLCGANNVNVSGGWVKEGGRKLIIRTIGEFQTLDEIQNLPLTGQGIRLGDVAEVEYAFPRQDSFNFLNGQEALTVSVYKASTANLLDVVDRVKVELEEIAELIQRRGGSVPLSSRLFRWTYVRVLGQLRNAGLLGGGLAIFFLFFFLEEGPHHAPRGYCHPYLGDLDIRHHVLPTPDGPFEHHHQHHQSHGIDAGGGDARG